MSFGRTRFFARLLSSYPKNCKFNSQPPTRCLAQSKNGQIFRSQPQFGESHHDQNFITVALLSASILSFFKKEEEESPEDKLIMTIKRSILCIQREEYDKAEQMLHLALRMAQDMQNKDGITYIYDVMANLAMEREQFKKAEKLFADVMKRLFAEGYSEDSNKILHISSKIAHMAQLEGNLDKALQGFQWTLQKLEEKMKSLRDDEELKELWALTKNWCGELLLEQGKFEDAKKCFLDAYDVFVELHGKLNQEAVTILNNLSVACTQLDDCPGAKKFLEEAIELVEQLPELTEIGVLKANLGLIYLREGMIEQAKQLCSFAWRMGKQFENEGAVQQADYCLKTIEEVMQNKK